MKLKLIRKLKEAEGTYSFFWEADVKVNWKPGQYFYYTVDELPFDDGRGDTRHFTISSSPTEGPEIRLTTRIRKESAFKKSLEAVRIGSQIKADGPHGSYILDEPKTNPQVFVAGGIGITPFRSFIKYAIDKDLATPMYLLYSNSDSEFVFGTELRELEKNSKNLKIIFYNSTDGGHLDPDKINAFMDKWGIKNSESDFWIVGPPPFVSALEEVIEGFGIDEERIHTEKFTGY